MKYFLLCVLSIGILCVACNDPLESNIFTSVQASVQVDSLEISAKTIKEDSVLTFTKLLNGNFSSTRYMFGQMEDATFGRSTATAYFTASTFDLTPFPSIDNIDVIDSVVMSIILDSLGSSGNLDDIHEISLHNLSAPLNLATDESLYHYEELEYDANPLHTLTQKIDYSDSLTLTSYTADTITFNDVPPQLRFKMDAQAWTDLFATPGTDTITSETLEELINGYALTSNSGVNSMVGIDLSNSVSSSNIQFYIKLKNDPNVDPNDTINDRRVFIMPLGLQRHNYFEHDYSGSAVGNAIDNETSELLYVQSQGGTNLEFDLESIANSNITILNSATIELTLIEEDTNFFKPATAIFAKYENENGSEEILFDLALDLSQMPFTFGQLETSGTSTTYNFDITNHVKSYLNGEITSSKIELYTENKGQIARRSIICGPAHPLYPAKLKIIKTNP